MRRAVKDGCGECHDGSLTDGLSLDYLMAGSCYGVPEAQNSPLKSLSVLLQ